MVLSCPRCGSQRFYKDGLRYLLDRSTKQRFLCRECCYRFSESEDSKGISGNSSKRQVCVTWPGAKNLESATETKTVAGETKTNQDIKGKLVQFIWQMQKENYSRETIRTYSSAIERLIQNKVDVSDPESVKEKLAKMQSSETYRNVIAAAYTLFLSMQGLTWNPPVYRRGRKIPFIPTEREIDDLIAGSGKKTASFLQLLKETAMRVGEASRLKWTDLDQERSTITLNETEKSGNPRMFDISSKLTAMLAALPRTNEYIWGTPSKITRASIFYRKRKSLAYKLKNPRLLQIGLHTFRHWKATMLYHETQNPLLVKEFLGHRNLDTTLLYIQIEKRLFKSASDKFEVKAVKDPEEIKSLIEVGFEFHCAKEGLLFFRKRK